MNKLLSLLAVLALIAVLIYGLSHAWMAMGVLKFGFIICAFVGIAFVWGRLTK